MEGKSAQIEMISMSRPSREKNRASSKNLRSSGGTQDSAPNPPLPSKKSQIRASTSSGASPQEASAPKKTKTGSETLAGVGAGVTGRAKKREASAGRGQKSSSTGKDKSARAIAGVVSKRRAEQNGGGGDVALGDALRPAKARKISGGGNGGAVVSSSASLPQVTSGPRFDGGINNGTQAASSTPATTTVAGGAFPDYALRGPLSPKFGVSGGGGGSAAAATATTAVDTANGGGYPGGESGTASGQVGDKASGESDGIADGELSGEGPSGPEPAGAAGEERKESRRDLRPRPQLSAPKLKKRTRFHEVTLRDGDGPRIVGRRIKVFWPLEKRFFYGHVKAFNGARKLQHRIVYDDKDEEWLRLQNEVFGIELLPGEVFGSPPTTTTTTSTAAATTSNAFLAAEAGAAPNDMREVDDTSRRAGASVADPDDDARGDATTAELVQAASPSSNLGEGTSRIKPEGVYRRKRKAAERTSEAEEEQREALEKEKQPKKRKRAATAGHQSERGRPIAVHLPEKQSEGRGGGVAKERQKTKRDGHGDGTEKEKEEAGDVGEKKKTERGREGTKDEAKTKRPVGKGKAGGVGLRKKKGGKEEAQDKQEHSQDGKEKLNKNNEKQKDKQKDTQQDKQQDKQKDKQKDKLKDKQREGQVQRGESAERLVHDNAKRGMGNLGPRNRRKRGAAVVQPVLPSRARRAKAKGEAPVIVGEGSSSSSSSSSSRTRRRRLEREKVPKSGGLTGNNSGSSSVRPRTRTHPNSISLEREDKDDVKGAKKETRRSRIRDDGNLPAVVKSSSAAVLGPSGNKASRNKREKKKKKSSPLSEEAGVEAALPRPPSFVDDGEATKDRIRILELSAAAEDGEKIHGKPTGQGPSPQLSGAGQRAPNAQAGPVDAVMDAYREALSGTKVSPPRSSTPDHGPEGFHHSAEEAVREGDVAFVANDDAVSSQDCGREEEGRGRRPDMTSQSCEKTNSPSNSDNRQQENVACRAAGGAVVTEAEAEPSAAPAEAAVLQRPDELLGEAGKELADGEEEMGVEEAEGRRIVGEAEDSTTEVVLSPLISPVTHRHIRPEIENSPPYKVFRRVRKYQRDKVYRRQKQSTNKVPKNGVDEPADHPQMLMLVPQSWSLARPFVPAANHVYSPMARIANLQNCNRFAFNWLRSRSRCEDRPLQLGTFYGAPSMHSLLRVFWTSLRWRFDSMPVSAHDVEGAGRAESSVTKTRMPNPLRPGAAPRRFKRPGITMCRRSASRPVTAPLSLSLHGTNDLKFLSLNTRHFRILGRKCRSLDLAASKRKVCQGEGALASAPYELPQGPLVVSAPSHISSISRGRSVGNLCAGQFSPSSDVFRRALALFHPWISRRRPSDTNRLLSERALESGPRSWSVEPAIPPSVTERSESCTELGTYYGRRTLDSFLRVTRSEISSGNVDSPPASTDDESRDVVKAGAEVPAAGGSVANTGSMIFEDSREGIEPSLPSADQAEGPESCASVGMDTESVPFLGPWFIDASTAGVLALVSGPAARARWVRAGVPGLLRRPSRTPDVAARKGAGYHIRARGRLSSPVVIGGEGALRLREVLDSRPKLSAEVQGADLNSEGRVIGAHYGPPSIESMLRVSADFWCRLAAAALRWSRQLVNENSSVSSEVDEGDAETAPGYRPIPEDTAVAESSDQGDGTGQDPSVAGDDLDYGKASSRAFGLLKKGRRTGTGLKRGFVQSGGESLGKDALPGDRFPEADPLSGRPISKRTKLEIENSDAALARDSGTAPASPTSDMDRKSFTTPSSSAQEKATASSGLPRMNVLKLRRCPTNKGVWLVAGNSCAAPADARTRANGAEAEPSAATNLRDFGSAEEPITPICEPSRKRMPEHILESPFIGRNDNFGNFAIAATPAGANTVSSDDSQDPEIMASVEKGTKGIPSNSGSPEVWFDCGITSMHGSVRDGLESRKRRRMGPSPVAGDDVDGPAEHSGRRSGKSSWSNCTANVLITKSDRCIRETGAVVDLQSGHGNSCMLTVSLHGESKYAIKADQPIATGTSNKFTHSMMWRGGKAWSLEFVDRKQWQMFKDLHEDCFQRNVRAASVRHIPIPGVKPIQEFPKSGQRFVRPPLKYIRQLDGEVETALLSPRVLYDMDSEDEEWLGQVNREKVSARGTRSRPKVDEDTLERVMDKLEKTSFMQQHEPISAEVGTELCQGLGTQDAIRAIHGYWAEKRQRHGPGLVRLFQPAPWERYQKQLQEWQAKIDQLQQQSPTATKQQLQSLYARPPLFAFCLRPRGLENRNKMQKQRSHRKQGLGGSSSRPWNVGGTPTDFALDSPSKKQAGFDNAIASLHGSRKFFRQRVQDDTFSDPMAVDLSESFNAMASEGFTPSPDLGQGTTDGTAVVFPRVDMSPALRFETANAGNFKRAKKLGRKAKKMKIIAAAEESRRRRLLRAHQAHPNGGRFIETVQSPLSDLSPFPANNESSTPGVPLAHPEGEYEDKVAKALAAEALAKDKRETATTLRSRAQELHAIADAAMQKAIAAVISADAIHAAERAAEDASDKDRAQPVGNHRQPTGAVPVAGKDDLSTPVWGGAGGPTAGGASFGSWRRALNSASKNANRLLSKGGSSSTTKPGLMADMDDALLPVASWSQELGAGLGTRLLQKAGEASPPRQRHSPVLVEGLPKSPARGVRGEGGLVSLGRTRGESMMAMLTR